MRNRIVARDKRTMGREAQGRGSRHSTLIVLLLGAAVIGAIAFLQTGSIAATGGQEFSNGDSSRILGFWLWDPPGPLIGKVKIFESDDGYFATWYYTDGTERSERLKPLAGNKYRVVGNSRGEFYQTLSDGRLALGDNSGVFDYADPRRQ